MRRARDRLVRDKILAAWPGSFSSSSYAHEHLHAYLYLTTGDGDKDHVRPEWKTLLPKAIAALQTAGL